MVTRNGECDNMKREGVRYVNMKEKVVVVGMSGASNDTERWAGDL